MRYFLGFLLASLIGFGSVYLAVSFIAWDFMSIGEWKSFDRFIFLLIGGIITVGAIPIVFMMTEE